MRKVLVGNAVHYSKLMAIFNSQVKFTSQYASVLLSKMLKFYFNNELETPFVFVVQEFIAQQKSMTNGSFIVQNIIYELITKGFISKIEKGNDLYHFWFNKSKLCSLLKLEKIEKTIIEEPVKMQEKESSIVEIESKKEDIMQEEKQTIIAETSKEISKTDNLKNCLIALKKAINEGIPTAPVCTKYKFSEELRLALVDLKILFKEGNGRATKWHWIHKEEISSILLKIILDTYDKRKSNIKSIGTKIAIGTSSAQNKVFIGVDKVESNTSQTTNTIFNLPLVEKIKKDFELTNESLNSSFEKLQEELDRFPNTVKQFRIQEAEQVLKNNKEKVLSFEHANATTIGLDNMQNVQEKEQKKSLLKRLINLLSFNKKEIKPKSFYKNHLNDDIKKLTKFRNIYYQQYREYSDLLEERVALYETFFNEGRD